MSITATKIFFFINFAGYDFNNKSIFKGLSNASSGISRNIKKDGRAEITHHERIPDDTLKAIFDLGYKVQKVMEARLEKDEEKYKDALKLLPKDYQDDYHKLLSMIVMFILMLYDCRRGQEKIQDLTVKHYKLCEEQG